MTGQSYPKGKYLWTAKIGEKGQLVIPKEAREIFSIHPGDTVLVLGDIEQGIALLTGDRCRAVLDMAYQQTKKDGKGQTDAGNRD